MSDKRNYMVLTSMSKESAAAGKKLLENAKALDFHAQPLWIDGGHVGFVLTTELPAIDVWRRVLEDVTNLRDVIIVEVGGDWCTDRESKPGHWFSTHLPRPLHTLERKIRR